MRYRAFALACPSRNWMLPCEAFPSQRRSTRQQGCKRVVCTLRCRTLPQFQHRGTDPNRCQALSRGCGTTSRANIAFRASKLSESIDFSEDFGRISKGILPGFIATNQKRDRNIKHRSTLTDGHPPRPMLAVKDPEGTTINADHASIIFVDFGLKILPE